MENQESSNFFKRFFKRTKKKSKNVDCTQEKAASSESRILAIEKAEDAKRAALCQRAERVCAAEKARTDAVLERLGLSIQAIGCQPSPKPPAFPREQAPSLRRAIPPVRVAECVGEDDEDDESFWEKLRLWSEEAQVAGKVQSPAASHSSVSSLSSAESHTPPELRAMSLIRSPVEVTGFKPTPPPPRAAPLTRRRVSRLPVFHPKLSGEVKVVADGCKLQAVMPKVEAVVERLQHFHLDSIRPPQPPAAAKRTIKETPLAPIPPAAKRTTKEAKLAPIPPAAKRTIKEAKLAPIPPAAKRTTEEVPLAPIPPAAPQTQRRGARPGMILRPAKAARGTGKTASNYNLQTARKVKVELQPLTKPVESLGRAFSLLSSDDWEKKTEGLKIIQALAQHHAETLKPKLHEVCLVIIEEVKNLRSVVACEAMSTLSELYTHLQEAMDPEVEGTGRALLLKLAQNTNAFSHQQVNLALDDMVENCSYGRIISALLNTGLSHLCNAVRGSTAQHLRQLVDKYGAAHVFTKRVLFAVAKMSVDAAPEVRHHGRLILHQLALHEDFLSLWTTIIPDCERRQLDKVLRK